MPEYYYIPALHNAAMKISVYEWFISLISYLYVQTQSKRSTKRMQWTESQMLAALDAVLNKHLSGNKADSW